MLARVVRRRFRGYAGSGLLERRRRERVTAPAPFSSPSLLEARAPRRALGLPGRVVEEVREEQKSVLSNRGARAAVPGFGSPVARFASLPWGCPILSQSGQTASFQHTQALSSIFASNLTLVLSKGAKIPWAPDRGTMERCCSSLRTAPSPGQSGGGGCEAPVCARSTGRAARDTTGFRAVRQECGGGSRGTKKCPEQPGRPGRLPGFRLSGCPASVPPFGTPSSVTQDKLHHTACASIVKHRKAPMSKLKRNGSPSSATALRASV